MADKGPPGDDKPFGGDLVPKEESIATAKGGASFEAKEESAVVAKGGGSSETKEEGAFMAKTESPFAAKGASSFEAKQEESAFSAKGQSSLAAKGGRGSPPEAKEESSFIAKGESSFVAKGGGSCEAKEASAAMPKADSALAAKPTSGPESAFAPTASYAFMPTVGGAFAPPRTDGALPEEDLGSLISFANLENVVKHIIKKFKSIEGHSETTNASILEVRRDVEARPTSSAVNEVFSELQNKLENVSRAMNGAQENITNIESQLERSRVTSLSIEKKLEACMKEKAVQDRMIRETQEKMEDKVSMAELSVFEAKFAGYATKLEHHELINSLSNYGRLEVVQRIAESVKVLGTQFDDYTRTAQLEHKLRELREWVFDEMSQYSDALQAKEKVEDLHNLIRNQSIGFERVQASVDDKIRGISDRVAFVYAEVNEELAQRALAEDLEEVRGSLRKYALRAETNAFQQDCMPKLKYCVDSIKAFDCRLKAQDDAIVRVDEILLDKAGKYDIVVLNSRLDQCLVKETGTREFKKMYERIEWMNKKFEQYTNSEADRWDKFRPPDHTPMFEDINARISLKADKVDLIEMYQLKANRIDADELSRLQDTIRKQLEYLAVTTFGLSKLALSEATAGDSKVSRSQQKVQVLKQSEALWHWILHSEPPSNLDMLRPPPGKGARTRLPAATPAPVPEMGQAAEGGDGKAAAESTREKRVLDNFKRAQLERKLGIPGGGG